MIKQKCGKVGQYFSLQCNLHKIFNKYSKSQLQLHKNKIINSHKYKSFTSKSTKSKTNKSATVERKRFDIVKLKMLFMR